MLHLLSKIYEHLINSQINQMVENVLLTFPCGFRKTISTKHVLDISGTFDVFLTDLSKVFDCSATLCTEH